MELRNAVSDREVDPVNDALLVGLSYDEVNGNDAEIVCVVDLDGDFDFDFCSECVGLLTVEDDGNVNETCEGTLVREWVCDGE